MKEKNVGVVNNQKIENSLSSIRKAIDSDEKDYEAGNEILLLLRNFQKNSNDKDNDIIYRKLSHIYKKKKSPNSNFHFMLSKNSPNKNSINNITSNKMIQAKKGKKKKKRKKKKKKKKKRKKRKRKKKKKKKMKTRKKTKKN